MTELVRPDRRELFDRLFAEFASSYPSSDAGRKHVSLYESTRKDARDGYQRLLDVERRGDDITELALTRLLPHSSSTFNRERGAWCTYAPAITREIKEWFQNAPHIRTDPKDWTRIAKELLEFVRRCTTTPAELDGACRALASKDYMRGFQTGMLSPILNALSPDQFVLVNNKSRTVLGYFLDEKLSGSIEEYPATSHKLQELGQTVSSTIASDDLPDELRALAPADRLDMFCHWVVAVKKYPLRDVRYWKIAPGGNADQWEACREGGFICIGWNHLGDLTGVSRKEYERRRDAHRKAHGGTKRGQDQVWRFVNRISEGDRIVANKGWSEVVGIGTVTGPYYFVPDAPLAHRLPVEWDDTERRSISKHGWSMTLCRLNQATFDEVAHAPIIEHRENADRVTKPPAGPVNPPYPLERLAEECFQEHAEVVRWVRAVERKGQVVFFGPPGTGKTYCAERLANHLVGGGNGFVRVVQFHPSYSYEDFIEGIRPRANDSGALEYPTVAGRFLDACGDAAKTSDCCVLIIDEINRANLSRVFGELMYLLEYRHKEVPLASGTKLKVPPNLMLIGTMNTADRSIALIDHALRRRFAFIRLPPRLEALERFHDENDTFDPSGLVAVLRRMNGAIEDPNYAVGVSFFMREDIADELADVWQMEIEPYLEEYFFDRPDRVEGFRWSKIASEVMAANELEQASE